MSFSDYIEHLAEFAEHGDIERFNTVRSQLDSGTIAACRSAQEASRRGFSRAVLNATAVLPSEAGSVDGLKRSMLGVRLRTLSERVDGVEHAVQLLDEARRVLPPHDEIVFQLTWKLATLLAAEQPTVAIGMLATRLGEYRTRVGRISPQFGRLAYIHGRLTLQTGDATTSLGSLREACDMLLLTEGEGSSHTWDAMETLGVASISCGHSDEAYSVFSSLKQWNESRVEAGSEQDRLQRVLVNLAGVHLKRHEYELAQVVLEPMVTDFADRGVEVTVLSVESAILLGLTYEALGELTKAYDMFMQALDQCDADDHAHDRVPGRPQLFLGRILQQQGRVADAVAVLHDSEALMRTYGATHTIEFAELQNTLAQLASDAHAHDEAIRRALRAYRLSCRSDARLVMLSSLAIAYWRAGRQPQAARCLRRTRLLLERSSMISEPDIVGILNNAALIAETEGDCELARELLERAVSTRIKQARQAGDWHDVVRGNLERVHSFLRGEAAVAGVFPQTPILLRAA